MEELTYSNIASLIAIGISLVATIINIFLMLRR